MGGAGGWVPPPNTDYESELLDNDLTPPSRDERHNINNDAPAGVRRPDLFAPSDDVKRHDSDDNDDMESVSGQANLQGDSGRYNSSDENTTVGPPVDMVMEVADHQESVKMFMEVPLSVRRVTLCRVICSARMITSTIPPCFSLTHHEIRMM